MADERNIEKDFRAIRQWLEAYKDMQQMADLVNYWIPIIRDSKSEFARQKSIQIELEEHTQRLEKQRNELLDEIKKAEEGKQVKLDEIDRACIAQQKESEVKIKPTQDALASLQGKVLTIKKELETLTEQKQEKIGTLDAEIQKRETRNIQLDQEFEAIRQRHFGA